MYLRVNVESFARSAASLVDLSKKYIPSCPVLFVRL